MVYEKPVMMVEVLNDDVITTSGGLVNGGNGTGNGFDSGLLD